MILEQGSHEELMARPQGGYAKLVAAQGGGARSNSMARIASKQRAASFAKVEAAKP